MQRTHISEIYTYLAASSWCFQLPNTVLHLTPRLTGVCLPSQGTCRWSLLYVVVTVSKQVTEGEDLQQLEEDREEFGLCVFLGDRTTAALCPWRQ